MPLDCNEYNYTALMARIDELEKRLNEKLDRKDKDEITRWMIPNYNKGRTININTQYTAECNGFLWCNAYRASQSSGHMDVTINGKVMQLWSNDYEMEQVMLPIQKGDTYSWTQAGLTLNQYTFVEFYPARQ